jgi:FlgN protein
MATTLEPFFDALRNELQQYGEMLALLETQQDALNHHGTHAVAASISSLTTQSAAIDAARRNRETLQRQVAWAMGVPEEQNVRQLIPIIPADYQPLLTALSQEIQELLVRVRECARQNRDHLHRSLVEMERFISNLSLAPQDAPKRAQDSLLDVDESPASSIAAAV